MGDEETRVLNLVEAYAAVRQALIDQIHTLVAEGKGTSDEAILVAERVAEIEDVLSYISSSVRGKETVA